MAADAIISNAAAIAACDAIVDLLDSGGAGTIKIYEGTVPADVDEAISGQTLLATLTLSNPAFGGAADGTGKATATADSITDDTSAAATGTASFFRGCDNGGTAVIQGTVGTADADMVLDDVNIIAGGTVSITSWTFSFPEQA